MTVPISYYEAESLEDVIGELDVLYMTRIQKERFDSEEEYFSQKNVYVLDNEKLKKAKPDLIVLHPLPRVDEILVEVDEDPRALYFKQARYGVFVRMSLILTMLESQGTIEPLLTGNTYKNVFCTNKRCITNSEYYLPKSFSGNGDTLICEFCDERVLNKY